MKSTRIAAAGSFLKPILVQVANALIKSKKHPEFTERYRRIKSHRGHKKAMIALCKMLLTAIWNILSTGESYNASGYLSGKQCNPGRIAKSLLVGSAPKPLKTRACALWLCRIPASFDLLASPEKQKRKAPVPVKLLRTASDTGGSIIVLGSLPVGDLSLLASSPVQEY